jgi:hypothetical protein
MHMSKNKYPLQKIMLFTSFEKTLNVFLNFGSAIFVKFIFDFSFNFWFKNAFKGFGLKSPFCPIFSDHKCSRTFAFMVQTIRSNAFLLNQNRDCQIFLGKTYSKREKIHISLTKYTKWP